MSLTSYISQGWKCQMTHISYIYYIFICIFVKLWFRTTFMKFMMKNADFCHLVQQELNVAYETSIFMLHKSWYKKVPEETELGTKPSLTLARSLTLCTGKRSFGHFTSSRCWCATGEYMIYMIYMINDLISYCCPCIVGVIGNTS